MNQRASKPAPLRDAAVPTQSALAVLVLDPEGAPCLALGEAADPLLRDLLLRHFDATAENGLATVRYAGRPLIVLRCRVGSHTLFIVHAADGSDALIEFVASVDFAYPLLNHMLSDRFEAITVIGADGRVRYISPTHETFFGLSRGEAIGMPVQNVIENTRLHHVVQTGQAEIGQIQEIRGESRVVARTPIRQNGRVIGAMGRVMFKGPDQLLALSHEVAALKRELAVTRRRLSGAPTQTRPLDMIIGRSDAVMQLKADLLRVAPLDVAVLLAGENGTGKELAAHALHTLGPRGGERMVLVNAAAMPATLVESEMFGYDPGAFTGADRRGRRGKFEMADKGTLFLDEIGDMPIEVQAKLLRVLQDKMVERVGGDRPRRSDFRLISATNRDLPEMTRDGRFRQDLFYRISTVVLRMPALRERLEDIRPIVDDFIRSQPRIRRIAADVYDHLSDQPWPGNIRQLLHEVERAIIFADGDTLRRSHFRFDPMARRADPAQAAPPPPAVSAPSRIHDSTHVVAQRMVREALVRLDGNKRRVAQELGISRSYLYRLLQTAERDQPR